MKNYSIITGICQYVWFAGVGNVWFEKGVIRNDNTFTYRIFQVFLISSYILMTIMEWLGVVYGDFPKDEHGDCVTFSVSHTFVILKVLSVLRNKQLIQKLTKKMVYICEDYENDKLTVEKFRTIKMNVFAHFGNVYGTWFFFIFEGFRKLLEGSHFVTIVTYYPPYEDNSALATATRVFTTFWLAVLILTMIAVDSLTLVYLIVYKYKIITLRLYFEGIRNTFDRESTVDLIMASKNLRDGLVKGIVMHGELISICKDIDTAFGGVLSLQLCLCSGSVVSLLLTLALSPDLTFLAAVKLIMFVIALYFLLAVFLCNTGDITYQAFLLSDAIFYCGWHMCDSRQRIGPLVKLSIKQAQRPLVLKAFNMIELTYGLFIQVLRNTYSVFALLYAQNK